jgi:glutathione S-transferase
MWGIAELGLEHKRLDYGHVHGGTDSAEFRAVSPHAVVPALRDGDLAMFESCAILRYLAARYGPLSGIGDAFWPADPVARAEVDKWAEWGKVSFCNDFTGPVFLPQVRVRAQDRDEAALALGIAGFEARLDKLEEQLAQHNFVASNSFTLADIVIGHVLFRWFGLETPRRPRAFIEAYYERLKSRQAYREHVMVSYEALRVR